MKFLNPLVAALCVSAWLVVPAFAAERNCCEKAKAEGKPCPHRCCTTAKKNGKVCEKCNPRKKDHQKKAEGQNQ